MRKLLLLLLFFSILMPGMSQDNFPVNGMVDRRANAYAFTNATIYTDYKTKIENATLLIKNGKVEAVGTSISVPAGYVVMDMAGKYIYPSFIDLHTNYGMPDVKRGGFSWGSTEQIMPKTKGAYNANDAIKADFEAEKNFIANQKQAASMRKLGFGTVLTFRPDGLARGTSSFVNLAEGNENSLILKGKAAAHYSFDKGSSQQDYPWSFMGFVAVLRQTHYDAEWYKTAKNELFFDNTLEAYNAQASLPQFFDVSDWQGILRANKMGSELGKKYIFKGNGDEYQRLEEIKATGSALVLPVNFPTAYKVEDALDALDISLDKMKHWELAPANLSLVADKGIDFSITTAGLKNKTVFWKNLRKAVSYGLTEEQALKALTLTPAQLVGVDAMVGSLEKGKLANFIVVSDNIFSDKAKIHHNWVQGNPFVLSPIDDTQYAGNYELKIGEQSYNLEVSGEKGAPSFKVILNDSTDLKLKGMVKNGLATLSFAPDKDMKEKRVRLSGWADAAKRIMGGQAAQPDGTMVSWSATFKSELEKKEKKGGEEAKKEEGDQPKLGEVIYPFTAYGSSVLPKQEDLIIKNATVWTNEKEGIIENADVIVKGGKIVKVGKNLNTNGLKVIDGTGKHLTSGIIDEHSHIALRSVNDVDVVSAQVRMSDVVDSEDIDIYRQLAGGVTAAQLLHGSANPVGGQSALVKLRWGVAPDAMLINGADGFIKFALGENVKNSRSSNSIRYPQTRMGVEQIYVDYFLRAQEYAKKWEDYRKNGGEKPRRDLQLEILVEILNSNRFISCHSYVQSEINMLMKVAERFNFRINTFTHILEGYKVADKMAKHGVAASTFSDWWAYKYEVKEAIPYNPILMQKEGVLVAINSDDAEMGRRLNQEAAKSVKYGGMSEEDAWKMVTLNPAMMLHLDKQMGSVKAGKDADLVLWSDNPLSIYAKAEKTFVDGVAYYDAERDAALQQYIQEERARLIEKMQNDKGGNKRTPMRKGNKHFHCDTMGNH